ncbi:hypothetical protein K435DRAFT_862502 [Dendrothele bispora CBS 962.96]|uniref:F-box domain-containing protein n=1 Tax=Dendrothele bispora (strain CBS 962.96) TaxID=1314807 RepID=A0A4S8LSZ0_DENBC|nr:hypothetical protein K435DRAFT_862502 [Dendrothele bispora CBS 962.96]
MSPIVAFLDFPDEVFLKIGSYLHCARSLQAFRKKADQQSNSPVHARPPTVGMSDDPTKARLPSFTDPGDGKLLFRQASATGPDLHHCLTKIELRKMTTTTSFWRDLFINLDAHKSNDSLRSLKLVECKVVDDIHADTYGLVFFKRLTLVLVRTVGINAFGHRFLLRGLDAIVVTGVRRNGMADLLPLLVRQGPTIRYLALCDKESVRHASLCPYNQMTGLERLFLGVAFPSRLVGKTVLLALENSKIPLQSLSITIEAFWPHNAALDVYLCNLARSKRSFLFNLNVKTLHHQVDFVTDIDTVRDVLPQVYRVLGPRLKMYHVSGYIAVRF